MKTIEQHIQYDKDLIENPMSSPAARRHAKAELHDLVEYQEHHPEDHHDPNALELFCDQNPEEPECLVYDD